MTFAGTMRKHASLVVLALIALAWTSVLFPGFVFPGWNNTYHVPIVLNYAASAEGPHNAFTHSLGNFVSGFWPALGLITTETNIFFVFFAAHLAGRIALVAGLYLTAWHFAVRPVTALALVALAAIAPIFKGVSIVGYTETLGTYLTHTGVAIALLPLCWWLMLRGRWVASAAMLGFIFNINAFISIWSALAALVALGVSERRAPDLLRRLILCGSVYAIMALPTAIWTLKTAFEPSIRIDYRAFLLNYYPMHTFVRTNWDLVARYAGFLVAAGLSIYMAARAVREARVLAVLLATYAAIFLLGVPLPYVTDSRLLLNLFPLRLDAVLNIGVAALVLGWAGKSLDADRGDTLPLATALFLLAGNMIAALICLRGIARRGADPLLSQVTTAAIIAVGLLLLVMDVTPGFGREFVPLTLLFGAIGLCAVAVSGPYQTKNTELLATGLALVWMFLPPTDRMSQLAVVATAVITLVLLLPMRLFAVPARWAVSPPVLLSSVVALGIGLSCYAIVRGTVERPDEPFAAEREAQKWMRTTLPPGTPYLPVGDVGGFSTLSRRPAWFDRREGAAAMWKPDFLPEWERRLTQVYACRDAPPCLAGVARRNGVPWVVAKTGYVTDPARDGLHLRFENSAYQIFSVDGAPPALKPKEQS